MALRPVAQAFQLWTGALAKRTLREGGSKGRMGPDHPSQSKLHIRAVGRALTAVVAVDRQGCAHRPEVWTKRRKAPVRNQHTRQPPHGAAVGAVGGGVLLGATLREGADLLPLGSLQSECR